jgi:hypothetical protein
MAVTRLGRRRADRRDDYAMARPAGGFGGASRMDSSAGASVNATCDEAPPVLRCCSISEIMSALGVHFADNQTIILCTSWQRSTTTRLASLTRTATTDPPLVPIGNFLLLRATLHLECVVARARVLASGECRWPTLRLASHGAWDGRCHCACERYLRAMKMTRTHYCMLANDMLTSHPDPGNWD